MSLWESVTVPLVRPPCPGCGRARLECWRMPCLELETLLEAAREGAEPGFGVLRAWCLLGGFDLELKNDGNPPLARPTFRVGDGAHYSFNGDSYPVTVIAVSPNGARVTVQKDRTARGLTSVSVGKARITVQREPGRALFIPDPKGRKMLFTRRKNGAYRSSGHGTWTLWPGREVEFNREF